MQRLFKLLQTFEKIQYAVESFLGNITVSPKNLGTGLSLEGKILYEIREELNFEQEVEDEMLYDRYVAIQKNEEAKEVTFRTTQTLLP